MILNHVTRIEVPIPQPFDFTLTVNKPAGWHWSTPREIFKDGKIWTGMYMGPLPVGLYMHQCPSGVCVSIFSESGLLSPVIETLQHAIEQALGKDEDLKGFYAFAKTDPILHQATKDLFGMRVGQFEAIFDRVILAILLQMAPIKRSRQMMDLLLENYGTKLIFDGQEVILWPRAETIALVPPALLAEKAKLGYRAGRLVAAAQYMVSNPVSWDSLAAMSNEQAIIRLKNIPGIGDYSAGIIYGRASVPIDSWSAVIMSELFLKKTPQDPRQEIPDLVRRLEKRWGQWGWMAFVYVLNDLVNLSKRFELSRIT